MRALAIGQELFGAAGVQAAAAHGYQQGSDLVHYTGIAQRTFGVDPEVPRY
jgi:hypothetical protein